MRLAILFVSLALPLLSSAGGVTNNSYSTDFLDSAYGKYTNAVERCEEKESTRPLPPDSAIRHLRQYDYQALRVAINAQALIAFDKCTQPEFGGLGVAIAMLRDVENPVIREKVDNITSLVFPKKWEMRVWYKQSPAELRKYLKSSSYFEKPYDAFAVLDLLEVK